MTWRPRGRSYLFGLLLDVQSTSKQEYSMKLKGAVIGPLVLFFGITGGYFLFRISDLKEVIPHHTDIKNILVMILMVSLPVGYGLSTEAIADIASPKRKHCRIALLLLGPMVIASSIGAAAFIF